MSNAIYLCVTCLFWPHLAAHLCGLCPRPLSVAPLGGLSRHPLSAYLSAFVSIGGGWGGHNCVLQSETFVGNFDGLLRMLSS